MESLTAVLETLTTHVQQIKWLTAALMGIVMLGMGSVIYLFVMLKKLFQEDKVPHKYTHKLKMLLDMDELDSVIELAQQRIKQYPSEIFAHWYLGQAYYRKNELHKALYEFNYIYKIAPAWRQKHLNPYIYDIKEQLKNIKPELVKG